MTYLLRLVACLFLCVSLNSFGDSFEFAPEDGAEGDQFGFSVALKGYTALVGAPYHDVIHSNEGALYVIEKVNGDWTQKQKLTASDAEENKYFGKQITLSEDGNYALVDDGYVFKKGEDENWFEQIKLDFSAGSSPTDRNTLIKDGFLIRGNNTQVDIYTLENENWILSTTLTSENFSDGDRYGESIAFDGEYLIVGSPGDYYTSSNAGSVYVYQYADNEWNYIIKSWGDDRTGGMEFGRDIQIFDNHVVIARDSGIHLFSHPRSDWAIQEVPINKMPYEWYVNYNNDNNYPLSGEFSQGPSYIGGSSSHRFNSNTRIYKQAENTLAFTVYISSGGRYCLSFSNIKSGQITIEGILNNDGSPSLGTCVSEYDPRLHMNDFDFDNNNFIRAYKSKNVWGTNSGAIYFEDLSDSLPEGSSIENATTFSGDLSAIVKQNGSVSGTLSAADPDGLTDGSYFTVTSSPTEGTAFIDQASGVWFYAANAQYEGDDSFIVTASDDQGNTSKQIITITVSGLTVSGDTDVIGYFNSTVTGDLNAQDADGLTTLFFTVSTPASNGNASIDAVSGAWSYTPNTDFIGADSFLINIAGIGYGNQLINIFVDHPDTDGDSIKDNIDNCINIVNPIQLDTDNDLQGDSCDIDDDNDSVEDNIDNCPISSNIEQSDLDQDGTGDACDPDKDGDGISNDIDNCLNDGNSNQNDLDNDSIGDVCDVDIDGDTVANTIEEKFGGDPSDPSDGEDILNDIEALNLSAFEVVIPAMGGIGLLALGLSMLGLGAVRLRRK